MRRHERGGLSEQTARPARRVVHAPPYGSRIPTINWPTDRGVRESPPNLPRRNSYASASTSGAGPSSVLVKRTRPMRATASARRSWSAVPSRKTVGKAPSSEGFTSMIAFMASSMAWPMWRVSLRALIHCQRALLGTQMTGPSVNSRSSRRSSTRSSSYPSASSRALSSERFPANVSETYFRKISPPTYSGRSIASTEPRSLSAASHTASLISCMAGGPSPSTVGAGLSRLCPSPSKHPREAVT